MFVDSPLISLTLLPPPWITPTRACIYFSFLDKSHLFSMLIHTFTLVYPGNTTTTINLHLSRRQCVVKSQVLAIKMRCKIWACTHANWGRCRAPLGTVLQLYHVTQGGSFRLKVGAGKRFVQDAEIKTERMWCRDGYKKKNTKNNLYAWGFDPLRDPKEPDTFLTELSKKEKKTIRAPLMHQVAHSCVEVSTNTLKHRIAAPEHF